MMGCRFANPTQPQPVRHLVVLGEVVFLVLLLFHYLYLKASDFQAYGAIWLTSTLFTVHFAWAVGSWKLLSGRWCDAYSLFFVSLCCFSGGRFFLVAFGLDSDRALFEDCGEREVVRAILLATASVIACHAAAVAAVLGAAMRRRIPGLRPAAPDPLLYDPMRLQTVAWLFVLISTPCILASLAEAVVVVSQQGYMGIYQQDVRWGIDNWREIAASFLVPGILLLLASAWRQRPVVIGCTLCMAAYVLTHLFMGTRGPASAAAIAFLLLYHHLVRRIKTVYVVCLIAAGLFAFPVIRNLREMDQHQRRNAYREIVASEEILWTDTIEEMGTSIVTLLHTIELVPDARPYDVGTGYWRAFLTSLPNVLGVERENYTIWYIQTTNPIEHARGGGMGYSVIAEAYVNFSWLGTPIVLGLMGFGLAGFVAWVRRTGQPFPLALEAIVVSAIIALPRAETANVVRPIVWFCLFPYWLVLRRPGLDAVLFGQPPAGKGNEAGRTRLESHGPSTAYPRPGPDRARPDARSASMIVAVTVEARFDRTPDGRVWAQAIFGHAFWQRYLDVFDGVRVVARIRDVPSPRAENLRADAPGVSFVPVPYYLGPWQYVAKAPAVRRAVRDAVRIEDAVILRVSSQLGNCMFPYLLRERHPYAVEVVGDPWDVFAPGVVQHPFRPFFRRYFARQLQRQCAHACGAAYVTEHALQRRYPTSAACYAAVYSSVELPDRAFAERPREFAEVAPDRPSAHRPVRLTLVGSLAQLYKGVDIALAAVAECTAAGLNLHLTVVGDGKYRPNLERQAAELGLTGRVQFRGQLPAGDGVRAELDRSHLFLMPSRTEGLPRAMIEAMARGLPCIGSSVGGIPELLADGDLVPPGDPVALASKVQEVAADRARLVRMSQRNFLRAKDFREETLRERRVAFYRFVRRCTDEWICRRRQAA